MSKKTVTQTDPFVNPSEEYLKAYGLLVTRLGQFERIILNLVKRCDQKLAKKTLPEIYAEYGSEPLGNWIRFLKSGEISKKNKRQIEVPPEYKKIKTTVTKFGAYRNEIMHSYYSKEESGKFSVRYINKGKGKKPKGSEKKIPVTAFVKTAKIKSQELYDLNKKINGMARS